MILLAEAINLEPTPDAQGNLLHTARLLDESSPKYRALNQLLSGPAIERWLRLHTYFVHFLGTDDPLVIVTDWSDPCEVVGLRLETPDGLRTYPKLCFLGLYTDWDDLPSSGIEHIFAHELSHVWLHWLGYQPQNSRTNRFHTCTAITDACLAFSEGFAEHFEIVSCPRPDDELYDHGYDLSAWLCNRDAALRQHAVKNNRFLYLTAEPQNADGLDYAELHALHNTSSAFLPEQLKNGRQTVASEGLIASFFYRITASEALRDARAADIYAAFGVTEDTLPREDNVYLKILYTLSKMDLGKDPLLTEFVSAYIEAFPADRDEMLELFGTITNFVTVRKEAQKIFADFYLCGRLGAPDALKTQYQTLKTFKLSCKQDILSGTVRLDAAVSPEIWVTADKEIAPVPWEPDRREKLKLDLNAATAIDLHALADISLEAARKLVELRELRNGFSTYADFADCVKQLCGLELCTHHSF